MTPTLNRLQSERWWLDISRWISDCQPLDRDFRYVTQICRLESLATTLLLAVSSEPHHRRRLPLFLIVVPWTKLSLGELCKN